MSAQSISIGWQQSNTINCFGFIDETGVLYHDTDQRFFAIGLLKCEDTTALYEQIHILKTKAEAKLDLHRKQKGDTSKHSFFEFKFADITRGMEEYYLELVDTYFRFPQITFSCVVIDKNIVKPDVFPSSWDAYIEYSKRLIAGSMKGNERICVIADFMGRPKLSNKFYEPQIRMLPCVYNATVLESHASLYIQLVDVLIGSVVFDFKRQRQPERKFDTVKSKVCDLLKKKLGLNSLLVGKRNEFSVIELIQ